MGATIHVIGDAFADVIAGPLGRQPVGGSDVEVSTASNQALSTIRIFIL